MTKLTHFLNLIRDIKNIKESDIDEMSKVYATPKNYLLSFVFYSELDDFEEKYENNTENQFRFKKVFNFLKNCNLNDIDVYKQNMAELFNIDISQYFQDVSKLSKTIHGFSENKLLLDVLTYQNVVLLNQLLMPFEEVYKNSLSSWDDFKKTLFVNPVAIDDYTSVISNRITVFAKYLNSISTEKNNLQDKKKSIDNFVKKNDFIEKIEQVNCSNRTLEECLSYYDFSAKHLKERYTSPEEAVYFSNLINAYFTIYNILDLHHKENLNDKSVGLKIMNVFLDEIDNLHKSKSIIKEKINISKSDIYSNSLINYLNQVTLTSFSSTSNQIVTNVENKVFANFEEFEKIKFIMSIQKVKGIGGFIKKLALNNIGKENESDGSQLFTGVELHKLFCNYNMSQLYKNEGFDGISKILYNTQYADRHNYSIDKLEKPQDKQQSTSKVVSINFKR